MTANQHIEHTRAAFADFLREQAEWRRARADEWPEDPRNRRSAEALSELASWVMRLPNGDERLRHLADCFPEEPPFLPVGDDVVRFARATDFRFPLIPTAS